MTIVAPFFQELETVINSQFATPIATYGATLTTALNQAFIAGMVI